MAICLQGKILAQIATPKLAARRRRMRRYWRTRSGELPAVRRSGWSTAELEMACARPAQSGRASNLAGDLPGPARTARSIGELLVHACMLHRPEPPPHLTTPCARPARASAHNAGLAARGSVRGGRAARRIAPRCHADVREEGGVGE